MIKNTLLHINNIYKSINGEVGNIPQGAQVVILRLQGCNLSCEYCDAPETQSILTTPDSYFLPVDDVFERLVEYNVKNILITGGEPLLQFDNLKKLVKKLTKAKKKIQIETNGTINKFIYHRNVTMVFDFKLNYVQKMMDMQKWKIIPDNSWIKLPIQTAEIEFSYAEMIYNRIKDERKWYSGRVYFALSAISPCDEQVLAAMICQSDNNDFVLNIQLHKKINVT